MTSTTNKPAKGGKLSNRLDALKSAFDAFTNPNIARNAKELGVFVGAITFGIARNPVVAAITGTTVAVAFDNWQDVKEAEVRARIAAAMDSPSGGNPNAKNGLPNSFGEYGRPDPSYSGGGDGYDVGYDEGQVDPRLAKAVNGVSTPTPPSTPTRPDSLPDQLSHQSDDSSDDAPTPTPPSTPTRPASLPDQLSHQSDDSSDDAPTPTPPSTPTRPDSLPDQLSYQGGDSGSGNGATHYDFYPFYTGTLTVEAINRGLDYFWSHYNEYCPHDSLDLATPFEYYQNLAR